MPQKTLFAIREPVLIDQKECVFCQVAQQPAFLDFANFIIYHIQFPFLFFLWFYGRHFSFVFFLESPFSLCHKLNRMMSNLNDYGDESFLFTFLLLTNVCAYMEAGSVPANLLSISDSFDLEPWQEGL